MAISEIINPIKQAAPKHIKIIPPTKSCFHEINKMNNKMREGILCINNPPRQLKKLLQLSKTSNEKIAKKRRKIIRTIRGVQKINLFDLGIIVLS
jgi:hypothetical protein